MHTFNVVTVYQVCFMYAPKIGGLQMLLKPMQYFGNGKWVAVICKVYSAVIAHTLYAQNLVSIKKKPPFICRYNYCLNNIICFYTGNNISAH